uniref:Uncharacterized protein n=1 Tax=Anguilla anguilla TaxID=7936 RepID=A0A0E9WU79_ANGAN
MQKGLTVLPRWPGLRNFTVFLSVRSDTVKPLVVFHVGFECVCVCVCSGLLGFTPLPAVNAHLILCFCWFFTSRVPYIVLFPLLDVLGSYNCFCFFKVGFLFSLH